MTTVVYVPGSPDPDHHNDSLLQYPYYVSIGYQAWEVRAEHNAWLTRTFGDSKSWHCEPFGGMYYFKREQDLTLFILWAS